jgi:hypothetical protein
MDRRAAAEVIRGFFAAAAVVMGRRTFAAGKEPLGATTSSGCTSCPVLLGGGTPLFPPGPIPVMLRTERVLEIDGVVQLQTTSGRDRHAEANH